MSFYCKECHFKNAEIQPAGEIQERGAKYTLTLHNLDDAERQVVKSDTAIIRIEDLDIEIPPGLGKLTNVEGILEGIRRDLENGQKKRKKDDPELYEQLDAIIQPLVKMMLGGRYPFTITLDDPAGNSWIEPIPGDTSSKYTCKEYARTPQQNATLGLGDEQSEGQSETSKVLSVQRAQTGEDKGGMEDVDVLDGSMYSLPCSCPGCGRQAFMNIQPVKIPYFTEVVVSAVICPSCGYKTSDVKTGGEIPSTGRRIWLQVQGPFDLRRDILKSETCLLRIPECNVEVQPGTMGGRFTTVEGLLTQIRDDLRSSIFDVGDEEGFGGDSMPEEKKKMWSSFFVQLDKAIQTEIQYTVIMEDPLSSSYVQSFTAPDPDPQIRTEDYERTVEEEEELGLADMKTQREADGEYVKEVIATGTKIDYDENGKMIKKARKVEVVKDGLEIGTGGEVVTNNLDTENERVIRLAQEEAQKKAAQIAAEEEEEL